MSSGTPRKPAWLKKRVPTGPAYGRVIRLLRDRALHTVCEEARCPNRSQCFHAGTATFLLLGDRCTRGCAFCAVRHGPTGPPDPREPARVAEAARELGLRFVVLTSVTRDDLPDGGAAHFAATVRETLQDGDEREVEALVPDFQGSAASLETVLAARPSVLNHNVETVPRLYASLRPQASYRGSLELLRRAASRGPGCVTKSGIMLGLGEMRSEVLGVMEDLRQAGCAILTLGQYLQPLAGKAAVERFVPPEEFEALRTEGLSMGFAEVVAGPYVRSSYRAAEAYAHARRGSDPPRRTPPRRFRT